MKKVRRYLISLKSLDRSSDITLACEDREMAYRLFELLSSPGLRVLKKLFLKLEEEQKGYPNFHWEIPLKIELSQTEVDLYENEQEARKAKDRYTRACEMKLIRSRKQKHA